MAININGSRLGTAGGSRAVTFNEAEELGAFELARRWADRLSWPVLDRTASDELAELACMSALACWLARWQPIHIHRAVLAGAELKAVANALGGSIDEVFRCWQAWASRQRASFIGAKPGVAAEDYEIVARVFAKAGCTTSGKEPHWGEGADKL